MSEQTTKHLITRLSGSEVKELDDTVVIESSLQINLNQTELATLMCSPGHEQALGTGFLFSEGLIDKAEDILSLEQKANSLYFTVSPEKFNQEQQLQKYISSGCGRGITFNLTRKALQLHKQNKTIAPVASAEQVLTLMQDFQTKSELFLNTGGVHSAALATPAEIIYFAEDIGRHNAVDKILGQALLDGQSLDGKLLLTSGRISSEIARKVAQAEIPIIVSRSAPTDRALLFAAELQMTVIGFARAKKMNVYTHKERLLIDSL
ncbi:formate dehydrogenase accessory sulfurtransferase FdhD [Candidatus Margulisiibacteriota bacterium]